MLPSIHFVQLILKSTTHNFKTLPKLSVFALATGSVVVGMKWSILINPLAVYASIINTRIDSQGALEVAGSGWLSENGVDIYSNGNSASNDAGANCVSVSGAPGGSGCAAGSVYSGEKWQCVEMINRLYLSRGWMSSTWWGNGNTLKNSLPSGVTYENNGSITILNPGDVITLDDGGDGHAGVINSVSGTSVQIANQNTVAVYSSATYSSGSITMSGWAGYTVQGVAHAPSTGLPNSALQMILDTSHNVWAKDSIGVGGWTQEASGGQTKMSASGGTQMMLDSSGNVWGKPSSPIGTSGWYEEQTGGITAIATGDNSVQLILDTSGNVWAKNTIGVGGWTGEVTGGITAISSFNGAQMVLDSSGNVWGKSNTSIGSSGWVGEVTGGITAIATGDNSLQIVLDSSGNVWANNTFSSSGWTEEQTGGISAITGG